MIALVKPQHYILYLVILISISLAGPLVVYSGAPGSVAAFWRLMISSLLAIIPWLRNPRVEPLQVLAGVFLALHFITWMQSLYLLPIGISTTIVIAYPLWSIIIDKAFRKEEISMRQITGTLIAFLAIAAMFIPMGGLDLNPLGLILSILGSLFAAVYFEINRHFRSGGLPLSALLFPVYFTAAATALLYNIVNGIELLAYPTRTYLVFIMLAIIPMIGGHTLMNYLLKYYKASKVTVIALGEPVGASIIAYYWFGQEIDAVHGFLMIIIILSLLLVLTEEEKAL